LVLQLTLNYRSANRQAADGMIAVTCRAELNQLEGRQEIRTDDNLPPLCSLWSPDRRVGCGCPLVYSSTESHFEKTGDLGDLIEAYCETCTREIEEAHKGHDEQVEAMRRVLESLPTHQP
jgi:hypothetical protein